MKYCPACNFAFPDLHRVCDFDGTELVQAPERQSLMRVPKRFPHPQRSLKKPMILTSLAVLGLFLSAVFIGYLESPAPSMPAIVRNQEAQNSPRGVTPAAKPTSQSDDVRKKTEPSKRTGNRRVKIAASSTARIRQRSVGENRVRNDAIARTDSKRTSGEKSPKVVAILKTTWKVLKKPFNF